jgi:hypothetical protein
LRAVNAFTVLYQVNPPIAINQVVSQVPNLVFHLPNANHSPDPAFESNLLLLIVQFTAIVVSPVVTLRNTALEKFNLFKLDIGWNRNLLLGLQVINTEVAELLLSPHKVFLSHKLQFVGARLNDMTCELLKSGRV